MKRNTALFGASLVAGVAAAAGLVATSSTSSAAGSTYYGVAWAYSPSAATSGGWKTGDYADPGIGAGPMAFSGTASAGSGTFKASVGSTLTVSAKCDGTDLITTANGKAYQPGQTADLGALVGGNAIGTVTFGSKMVGGHTVGAYIDLSASGDGWVALTGADCAAETTPPTSTTSPTTGPTSTTNPPTSTATNPPTTGTNPPTSTGTATNPPTSTGTVPPTGGPTTTPPPTTEPPTPTPTTTTLPVTG